jgi:hypothetical protein
VVWRRLGIVGLALKVVNHTLVFPFDLEKNPTPLKRQEHNLVIVPSQAGILDIQEL